MVYFNPTQFLGKHIEVQGILWLRELPIESIQHYHTNAQ